MELTQPRVFQSGAVTVALNGNGATLYIAQHQINFVRSFAIRYDAEKQESTLDLSFYSSHDGAVALKIEESVRVAKSLPWVRVQG